MKAILNKWAVHLLFEQIALLIWVCLCVGTSCLFWYNVHSSIESEQLTWLFFAFMVGIYFGCSVFTTRLRMTMSTDFLKELEFYKGDIEPRVFIFYRRKKSVIWNNIVSSLCMCLLLLNNAEGELIWFSVFITALYSMMSVLLVYLYSLRLKGVSLSNAK